MTTYLSDLLEVKFHRLNVVVKSEGCHGVENIITRDCFTLLLSTTVHCSEGVKARYKTEGGGEGGREGGRGGGGGGEQMELDTRW